MQIGEQGIVTGTQVAYATICHRKLWLFSHGITMEVFSERVDEGRSLHVLSYPRQTKEVEVPDAGVKVDFCEKDGTIHEIKLSPSMEDSHILQLAYYLSLFQKHGHEIARGVIHYPRCRKTQEVFLTKEIQQKLKEALTTVQIVTQHKKIPDVLSNQTICRKCAYFEFCFA